MTFFKYSILIGLGATVLYIIPSYRGFLALGPGGLPHNFLGYSIQAIAQPIARRNTTTIASLQDPRNDVQCGKSARVSFLSATLPLRQGDRPIVPGYVAPQRQASQQTDNAQVIRMNAFLNSLIKGELEMKASQLESKDYQAVWVTNPSEYLTSTKGEIIHVHAEGSSHLILSLSDAEEAITKGWAELHKLSGIMGRLPSSYVLVYAPRDDAEFKVWKNLVTAAARFNTAS